MGSRFAEDNRTLTAVTHRICCADSVVKRLNPRVFARKSVGGRLKGRFIASAVLASLLYGLKFCAFGKRDLRCLDGFYLRLVKRVMHLPHDFHLSYAEAEARSGVPRPSLHLTKDRLRWTGHALRSDEKVLTEVLLFVPEGGRRGRGRPRLRFYDTVKADLNARGIVVNARQQDQFWRIVANLAADRKKWRSDIVEKQV